MIFLGFDSSAKATSVAAGDESSIFAEFSAMVRLTHSQTLMPMLDSVLKCTGVSLSDVDFFAVSTGPGSFTGLRIGIGAVKGLACGTGRPCVGVSTLESLAHNLPGVEGIICAAMDARCGQVYTASFDSSPDTLLRLTPDEALSIDDLLKRLLSLAGAKKNVFFVGDGAELCYNKLKGQLENPHLAGEALRFQKASSVILAARKKLHLEDSVTASQLAPSYLRLPQAQRNLLANSAKKSLLEELHG